MQHRSTGLKYLVGILLWFLATGVHARALEIKGVALSVSDLNRSIAFYETALGFKKVGERVIAAPDYDYVTGVFGSRIRSATLRLGAETIELEQYLSPAGTPIPRDSRANDLWFQHFAIVVSDMDKAYARLSETSFQAISSAPQTIPVSNTAAAGIRAYKFKDPDGHPLELLYFPAGKGNPKWQQPTGEVFLGIDHSAITVGDTERSLHFYQDLLGLKVAGSSLNTGLTQERLDGAPGAVVRVTGLRPEAVTGPGLEFLEYQMPDDGRPAPATSRANDIAHVHVVLEVDDLDSLADRLTREGARFVSPRVISVGGMPFAKYLMVADPDGHAVLLVQRAP